MIGAAHPIIVPLARILRDDARLAAVRSRFAALAAWENTYTARLVQHRGALRPEQSSVLSIIHHRLTAGGR